MWEPSSNPSGITELEVAAGVVFGLSHGSRSAIRGPSNPLAVLRELAISSLATPPCVIAFSGGRDSSALLAVFVDVARKEGLPEPIAVTARWEDSDSDESAWQEEVVRAIGASQWQIIRPGTDLDLLGREATEALGRSGLMWPAPAYALLPMIRMASGGVFITGEGGDEAFGLWPFARAWSKLRSGHVPHRSDLRSLVLGSAPLAIRRHRWRPTSSPYQSWLRPQAFRRVAELLADENAADPVRWDKYQAMTLGRRDVILGKRTFDWLCRSEGARPATPFLEEEFLAALARWGGFSGRGDRTSVMSLLFGELLPGPILSRRTKATFGGVFWGPASRRFAEEWDGKGLDPYLVDVKAIRRAWLEPTPLYGAALPLHAAWLHSRIPGPDS